MTLIIPTEGPCAGPPPHACDMCYLCRHGHCCRRDCPTYERPKLGDWKEPIYGELGVLAVSADDNYVQCHACGEWHRKLGGHILWSHDLFADEYRALFGLKQRTGLAAPTYKQEVREQNKDRLPLIRPAQSYFATLTPEQRSAFRDQTQWPLETVRDPKYKEARKRVGTLTTARARRYFCKCGCGTLMPPGHGAHRGQRYIRGHVPPSLADRVATTLASAGEPLDVATILAAHPEEHTQVRRALVKLVRAGRAERTERGTYQALPCKTQQQEKQQEKEGEHHPCTTTPPTAPSS